MRLVKIRRTRPLKWDLSSILPCFDTTSHQLLFLLRYPIYTLKLGWWTLYDFKLCWSDRWNAIAVIGVSSVVLYGWTAIFNENLWVSYDAIVVKILFNFIFGGVSLRLASSTWNSAVSWFKGLRNLANLKFRAVNTVLIRDLIVNLAQTYTCHVWYKFTSVAHLRV